jgi:hypothetical protein
MQILHPFVGSLQQYAATLTDPDRYRPPRCPQCDARQPLTAHGFYQRTLVDEAGDGVIRVRRYLCRSCRRTVSLLPEFVLPYLRFSLAVIARFLTARLGEGRTLAAAALVAWTPVVPAPTFALRALHMLTAGGWISAHRGLFAALRVHLLGWPASLAPVGRVATLRPALPAS